MTGSTNGERWTVWIRITVLVRLLADERGELEYGEVADLHGVLIGRFRDWPELLLLLRKQIKESQPNS